MTPSSVDHRRRPLLAGNWKMHKTSAEGAAFVGDLIRALGSVDDRDVLVGPTFVGLAEAVKAAEGSVVGVMAQDVFWEPEGAYTGEVAPGMLVDLGVVATVIGHSERRQHFGETDVGVAKKVRAALDHGLLPIMCIGETEEERDLGLTEKVLSTQVPAGLVSIRPEEAALLVIAYEPIWAIGTGKTATPAIAQEAIAYIRAQVGLLLGADAAASVRILYGGSVKPDNIDDLMGRPDIDGALVGGASLQVESFRRIVHYEVV
ncbi:MAG: triose-phosphate isomerase [Thermoleophilia bacterium]|jgi:triosephosphate isomerase